MTWHLIKNHAKSKFKFENLEPSYIFGNMSNQITKPKTLLQDGNSIESILLRIYILLKYYNIIKV